MPLTPEMTTIKDFIENEKEHVLINAVAGAGKTYFLCELINNILKDKNILNIAFGKDAVHELMSRITNPNVKVMTHHSLGMMLCRGNLLKSKKERFVDAENVEQWKNFNIMGDLIGSEERKSKLKWLGPIDKIHKYFKNNAICNPTIKDVEEAYLNPMLLSNYARNKIKEKELPDMQALCLAMYFRGINRRDKFGRFECSFDDMVFWPVYNKWKLPEYEYILIDEVQDYNPVQIEVISNFAKAGSRVVAVGDRQQAIYGWRGAIKAMDKLKERLEE